MKTILLRAFGRDTDCKSDSYRFRNKLQTNCYQAKIPNAEINFDNLSIICGEKREFRYKCSQYTALRDIQDLIKKNILQKETRGGRSTNYELKVMN